MSKVIKLHDFSDSDWMMWAGAEEVSDAQPPQIGECDKFLVIVDNNGVFVYVSAMEDGDGPSYELHCTFVLGKIVAADLLDKHYGDSNAELYNCLNQLGFKRTN